LIKTENQIVNIRKQGIAYAYVQKNELITVGA